MNRFRYFCRCILNQGSYVIVATIVLILFFISIALALGDIQRSNYNSEVRCSIRADSYDCKTIDTYFNPKDKKTNEAYCKKDEVALFSEPSGGNFIRCTGLIAPLLTH